MLWPNNWQIYPVPYKCIYDRQGCFEYSSFEYKYEYEYLPYENEYEYSTHN